MHRSPFNLLTILHAFLSLTSRTAPADQESVGAALRVQLFTHGFQYNPSLKLFGNNRRSKSFIFALTIHETGAQFCLYIGHSKFVMLDKIWGSNLDFA